LSLDRGALAPPTPAVADDPIPPVVLAPVPVVELPVEPLVDEPPVAELPLVEAPVVEPVELAPVVEDPLIPDNPLLVEEPPETALWLLPWPELDAP